MKHDRAYEGHVHIKERGFLTPVFDSIFLVFSFDSVLEIQIQFSSVHLLLLSEIIICRLAKLEKYTHRKQNNMN